MLRYNHDLNIFVIPVLVLFLTRGIKFVIFYFKYNRDFTYTKKHAMSYGHMPSVHTSLMTSNMLSIGYYEGITSGAFAVAVVLALIIVDDATRLRVYLGNLGKYINMLSKEVGVQDQKEYPRIKERMGHRRVEVLAGALVGLTLTLMLIYILR